MFRQAALNQDTDWNAIRSQLPQIVQHYKDSRVPS